MFVILSVMLFILLSNDIQTNSSNSRLGLSINYYIVIHSYLASVVAQCRQTEEVTGAAWNKTWASHHLRILGTEDKLCVNPEIPLGKNR